MVMTVITHLKVIPIHGYESLPTGRRTQSMAMIVTIHWKANPIHGYDSNYTKEGEPNPWL
jgi:hypothetical protein